MKKIFEFLSSKLFLTPTELKIFLFLIGSLVLGFFINIWKSNQENDILEFDYSTQDSLFFAASNNSDIDSLEDENNNSVKEKNNKSILEKNNSEKEIISRKSVSNKVIKINFASVEELNQLPGIGLKTAQNIVEYRKKIGGYSNADELLNVKGIGKSKLEKIKMLLNFEK